MAVIESVAAVAPTSLGATEAARMKATSSPVMIHPAFFMPLSPDRCSCRSRITSLHLRHRLRDDGLQHVRIDVREPLQVDAGLRRGLVLAQLCQQLLLRRRIARYIDADAVGAGREPGQAHVALSSAVVPVVVAAEADDARAPHARLLPGDRGHELRQGLAILAAGFVADGSEILLDAGLGELRLVGVAGALCFGHGYPGSGHCSAGASPAR